MRIYRASELRDKITGRRNGFDAYPSRACIALSVLVVEMRRGRVQYRSSCGGRVPQTPGVGSDAATEDNSAGRVAAQPANGQERGDVLRQAASSGKAKRVWNIQLHRSNPPAVPGVLTPGAMPADRAVYRRRAGILGSHPVVRGGTYRSVGSCGVRDGPTTAGLLKPARAAFDWSRRTERPDAPGPSSSARGLSKMPTATPTSAPTSLRCVAPRAGHRRRVVRRGDVADGARRRSISSSVYRSATADLLGQGKSGVVPEALLTGCASVYPQHSVCPGARRPCRGAAAGMGTGAGPTGSRDRGPSGRVH